MKEITDFSSGMAELHDRASVAITAIEQRLNAGPVTTLPPEDVAVLDGVRAAQEAQTVQLEALGVPNP